ncbi:hypothetical protein PMAYCL1PPCAC_29765 [Pristionchus mayeri]|uniref:Uncharacterized protein n=1 Tax=Pristionchus mayeri TaxID=1317129 RepID=A0AAN5DBJ1_9BILA|nr:hypothetical protein PMAYCL1PPCAC_29765 [Pristionchus mayeri]
MLSRLATRSFRCSSTWLNFYSTYPVQAVDDPGSSQTIVALPQSCNEVAKCSSQISQFRSCDSSSFNSEERHDESGEESEEEEVKASDGLDAKTREQYIMKEARKRLTAEGAAPVTNKALDSLERHLLYRSGVKKSMMPLSVSLFNFHSQIFAQRLLDRSVSNLVLVESALEHSMKAKEFSRSVRRKGHRVEAVHADATALFGLEKGKKDKGAYRKKKKPPPFSFPDKLVARPRENDEDRRVMSLRLRTNADRPLTHVISPIIVCSLGSHTQQTAVLDAFLHSLLKHHLKIDEKGLFALGDVELITYLHSEHAAHLLSSTLPSLSFVSHAARRRSQLMHTLFHFGHLEPALSSSSFSPHNIPPSKKMAHEKKMKEAGFLPSRWFGCWLRPRSTVSIGGKEIVAGGGHEDDCLAVEELSPTLPSSVLLPYAMWCEALGKFPGTKKADDVLSSLIPGSASAVHSIVPSGAKIGEVTLDDTDAIFLQALPELTDSPNVAKYREKHLLKGEDKTKFAD